MAPPILVSGLFIIPQGSTEDVVIGQLNVSNALPLRGIVAEAQVVDLCAEVKLHQRYQNANAWPVEAVYVFPIDERAAVSGFEARIRDRVIVADVQEKQEARATYEAAKSQGHGAYLLEECREDVFRVKVGNIPAGETVEITVTYVAELKVEGGQGDSIRFLLPTAVAPRYTPSSDPRADEPIPSNSLAPWRTFWPYVSPSSSSSSPRVIPDGLRFHLEARTESGIASISSPTHAIAVTRSGEKKKEASVDLAFGTASLGGDIVVLVNLAEDSSSSTRRIATLVVEEEENNKNSWACMLTLIPRFELDDVRTDIVFVIDRSGSMAGSQIQQAGHAMQLFLRSLPTDCYFNIIGFGSSHETLFAQPTKYSQQSLAVASNHVKNLQANLGGTEIMQPLRAAVGATVMPGYPRQIFVLTDGQVSNTEQVCEFVRASSNTARFFALGIGADVSHALVEGIARNGKGTAAFVHAGEAMEGKVMKQLKQAIQPAITDVKIEWVGVENGGAAASAPPPVKSLLGYRKPDATEGPIMQTPYVVPPVFNGERFTVYALLKPGVNRPTKAIVRATTPDGPLEAEVEISEQDDIVQGDIVHRLAARSLLRDIADSSSFLHRSEGGGFRVPSAEAIKSFAVQIGKRYKLASRYTSFVAVEERVGAERVVVPVFYQRPVVVAPSFDYVAMGSMQLQSASLAKPRYYSGAALRGSSNVSVGCAAPASINLSYNEPPKEAAACIGGGSSSSRNRSAPRAFGAPSPPSTWIQQASDDECEEASAGAPARRSRSSSASSSSSSGGAAATTTTTVIKKKDSAKSVAKPSSSARPSSAVAAASAKTPREVLRALVPLQQFDGSFQLTDQLASLSRKSLAALRSAKPAATINDDSWATAIAVAIFVVFASDLSDEWEMVANKAKSWLKKQLEPSISLDGLLSAAETFIKSQ